MAGFGGGMAGGAAVNIAIKAFDQTKQAFSSVRQNAQSLGQRMQRIGPAVAGVGMAMVGAVAATTGAFREYNAHLERAALATGMTADETKKLGDIAYGLSDAVIGPTKLAEGLHALAKISKEAALSEETVTKYTDLAKASQMDFAQVVAQATDVLGIFGKGAEDIGEVQDRFTKITQVSSWALSDLMGVLIKMGPTASAVGMSLDECSTILGMMAERGLATRSAASGLKMALAGLSDPAGKATLAFEAMGVTAYDAEGKLRPANELLMELADRFAEIEDPTMKTNAAIGIFGRDAGPVMVDILSKGSAAFTDFNAKLEGATGLTEQMAEVTENAVSPMGHFMAMIEKLRIQVGAALAPFEGIITVFGSMMMGMGGLMTMAPKLGGMFRWMGRSIGGVFSYIGKGAAWMVKGVMGAFGAISKGIGFMVTTAFPALGHAFITVGRGALGLIKHFVVLIAKVAATAAAVIGKAIAWLYMHAAMKFGIFGVIAATVAVAGLIGAIVIATNEVKNLFGGSPGGQLERSLRHATGVLKNYTGEMRREFEGLVPPIGVGGEAMAMAAAAPVTKTTHVSLQFNVSERLDRGELRHVIRDAYDIAEEEANR